MVKVAGVLVELAAGDYQVLQILRDSLQKRFNRSGIILAMMNMFCKLEKNASFIKQKKPLESRHEQNSMQNTRQDSHLHLNGFQNPKSKAGIKAEEEIKAV